MLAFKIGLPTDVAPESRVPRRKFRHAIRPAKEAATIAH